jgi:hypothetical protein
MKVDFTINCNNPGVVFAIADALKAAGFNVRGCGVMISSQEPDIECDPPIDFIDKVPDALLGFVDGSGKVPTGSARESE